MVRSSRLFLCTFAFAAICSAAQAVPITFAFTGTVVDGSASLLGQTVVGSLTYDVDLATGRSECCSIGTVARLDYGQTVAGEAPYAFGSVALSGGLLLTLGQGSLGNSGSSEVIKLAGEEGSPGPQNSFTVESSSNDLNGASTMLSIKTRDLLGEASLIFPLVSAGLATDQPVVWNTPGASTFGFLQTSVDNAAVLQATFTLDRITVAVPEPSNAALMLAGLVGLAAVGAKRRRSA